MFGLLLMLTALAAISGFFMFWRKGAAEQAVLDTRRALHEQGFKTDLSDFNFSSSPGLLGREAILLAAAPNRVGEPFANHPNLMEAVSDNSVVVVSAQAFLRKEYPAWPDTSDRLTWDEFREAIQSNRQAVEAACDAVLSGPVVFNLKASAGGAMLLPHLAMLKNLTMTLGSRTVLEIHDGNRDAAWTNLMAATRLVTAWDTEPVEISQLVRFGNTALAFKVLWQALQTNCWTEAQLATLQQEWESVDFFKKLPETVAFKRACAVADCQRERERTLLDGMPLSEFFKKLCRNPRDTWSYILSFKKQIQYANQGSYEDEKQLLLFYRDREVELRNTVRAASWSAMRRLPGVMNVPVFQSQHGSRMHSRLILRELGMGFQRQGSGFPGRAAEAEARRRMLVTALALERFHLHHGRYPNRLSELVPDFMTTAPLDFMDGQPLRYHAETNGHFLLYSVGLDCVDNGGRTRKTLRDVGFEPANPLTGTQRESDLVWPLPAASAAVAAKRMEEQTALAQQKDVFENQSAAAQWSHAASHQAGAAAVLALPAVTKVADLMFHGYPLSELLRNAKSGGTNKLSLCQLLTLQQITTGGEPETVTFELPIAYQVMTNLGTLSLIVDTNNDDYDGGSLAQQMDCECNPVNGDSLLVWSTIYEAPGLHALQAGLTLNEFPPDKQDFYGPWQPYEVTNLAQFSLGSANYDIENGATFHARLPEQNGSYTIECLATNGEHLKTIKGSTTNGSFKVVWDLVDDQGRRLQGETFNSVIHLNLPDSGRSQTLKGP